MRKLFTLLIALILWAGSSWGQVNYTFNFEANSTGWTGNFTRFTGATACGGAGGAMRRNLYSSAATGQLISPLTGNSAGGLITMSYDYKVCNWSANTVGTPNPWGSFDVQYGATATGPWTTVATVNQTNHVVSGSCATKTLTFTAPAGPVYIRFSATWAAGDYYLNYDNIVLSEATAPCSGTPAPGNTLASTNPVCAFGSFVLSLQNATIGSGVTYQWQSSPNGTTWTNFGTSSASQTISQSVATYYQCIVTCSGNSGTSTPVLVNMVADYTTCYCIPTTTSGCTDGDVIARVQLNTLDNNSGTDCPSELLGYSNYTDYSSNPEWTTDLMPASTYTCTVWAGQYSEGYAAWIDYNDDGYFDNATERIGYSNGQVAGSGVAGTLGSSASFPISLACSPRPGEHRLRVRAMYAVNGNAVTPCASNTYGETEDYLINIIGAPACASPGSLASVNASSTSVLLNINMGCSEATEFDFEYGPVGFTQGAGTLLLSQALSVNTGIGSYTLTGLTANTPYDVYFRANCGASGTSTWNGPFTVTTSLECPVGAYSETEVCGTDANGGCNMAAPAFEPIVVDQPICGNSWCDGSARDTDWYEFTLTGTSNVTLSANVQFGATIGLIAAPCPASAFITSTNILAGATGSVTTTLVAGTYYAFTAPSVFTTVIDCGNGNAYNLTLTAVAGCLAPTALTASNIQLSSADLGWTAGGSETQWNIEWGESGFTLGTGTIINGVTSNPYPLGGLVPSTAYSFYVQADCGGGTLSTWAGPYSFTTLCDVAAAPYAQPFTATTIPACWTMSGPQTWLFNTTWSDYGADALTDHTSGGGTNYAGVDGSGSVSLTGITLLSQLIDITGVVNPQVSFYMFNNNNSSVVLADEQKLTIDIWDGAAWQTGAFVWDYGQNAAGWQQKVISLSSYTITGPIQLRFVVDKGSGSPFYDDMIIDDVVVEAAPTCMAPTNLVVTPGSTSAEIDWTEAGTATQWIVEYGPQGFTLGTGISVPVGSKPATLTPLTVNTSYSFYVRADCGGGDLSAWSSVKNFSTTQIPATLPFTEDFELGFGDWSVLNGTQVNQWYTGTATAYSGTQSAYISNDAGVSNAYTNTSSSVVHFYRDITFPAGADGYALSFYWKGLGETGLWDYLSVWLVEPATLPVAGTMLTSGQVGVNYYNQTTYQHPTIYIPNTVAGTTKRLVFTWKNDGTLGNPPPTSIDDILLQTATYATVTTDATSAIAATTATSGGNVTGDGNLPVTARGVCWNLTGTPTIGDNFTTDGTGTGVFTSNMTSLVPGSQYYVMAYATNAIGTAYGNEEVFTTGHNITFQVNMSQQTVSPDGVHLAGSFQGWDPSATLMTDMGSGVWAITLPLAAGDYQYKFVNGNAWGQDESIPGACNVGGNRGVTVVTTATLDLVCFGSCSNCVTQIPLTLTVDMANQTVSPLGVHVAGSFQGWNPGSTVMTQIPTTTMYEVMVYVDENSTHQYKFINGNDWPDSEVVPGACGVDNGFGGFNRSVSVTTGMYSADVVCFGECGLCTSGSKTLNLTAFLEGLYIGGNAMHEAMNDLGEPQWGAGVADQITVELHNEMDYLTIEHTASNVDLNTDGTATVSIPDTYAGMYYVTIKHRNSVETTTATPVDFSGASIDYNFTTAAAQAFGDNQIDLGEGVFGIFIGDANQDGIIDGDDLVFMDPDVIAGNIGYLASDLNGDGLVDGDDLVKGDTNIIAGVALATP